MSIFFVILNLLERKIPTIIVRILVYIYTSQEAWVKWGSVCSEAFNISNRTRQGSVLLPALFSMYIDDLIKILENWDLVAELVGSGWQLLVLLMIYY